MRAPIAYDVLTPFGQRFRVTAEEVRAMVAGKKLHVRECADGSIAVRSWWEKRETFYSPVYRNVEAA